MIKIPIDFDGEKFAEKYALDPINDFWSDGEFLHCPSLPDLTDDDLLDCLVTPVYSITPQQTLVAVGGTVTISVTGAPDATETVTIDGIQLSVTLDESGRTEIVQTCESAGIIYIRDAHGNIVKIEVANV